MKFFRGIWERWVRLWVGEESPESLALVRIGIGAVALYDFLETARLGLVETLWAPWGHGGVADVLVREPMPPIYAWLPASPYTAWGVWSVAVVASFCLMVGFFSRFSALALMFAWAQVALITPNSDRGIDMLVRNVLFILAFSGCGQRWGVDASRGGAALVPAWPRRVLIVQLVVMYFTAGVQKFGSSWLPVGGFTAIYVILHDPMIAHWSPAWLSTAFPLTRLGTIGTLFFEWSAPALLLSLWYRATRTRGGWLRANMNRLDTRTLWVLLGVGLHLGIAVTMQLGIFPWAMLALYPAFYHPDELRRWPGFRQSLRPVLKTG